MAKKTGKKVTTVHSHPMHVPVSKKNPSGVTIRDQHQRRLPGTYLDLNEINSIFRDYDRTNIVYPAAGKLSEYKEKARWLAWKRERAMSKLGRAPTNEEIILEYKGLLKSKSPYKNSALEKYRNAYAALNKK